MATQKQRMPSFASIRSVLCIMFYCAGFFSVKLELHEQKKRINALENNAESKQQPSREPNLVKTHRSLSGMLFRLIENLSVSNVGQQSVRVSRKQRPREHRPQTSKLLVLFKT